MTVFLLDETGRIGSGSTPARGLPPPPGGGLMETFWCGVCEQEIENEPTFSHALASRRRSGRLRTCPVCRSAFHPARADVLYCSPRCRQKAWRLGKEAIQDRMENDAFMRRCQAPGCVNSLAGRTARAQYCSPTCRVRAAYHHRGVRA